MAVNAVTPSQFPDPLTRLTLAREQFRQIRQEAGARERLYRAALEDRREGKVLLTAAAVELESAVEALITELGPDALKRVMVGGGRHGR